MESPKLLPQLTSFATICMGNIVSGILLTDPSLSKGKQSCAFCLQPSETNFCLDLLHLSSALYCKGRLNQLKTGPLRPLQVDILRELQRLASRVDSVMFEVSQVKQVQFTLESLIRSSANARKAGTAPKKRLRKKGAKGKEKGSDAQPPAVLVPINEHFGGAETDEADNLYDWPPVKTVEECWREMYEGLDGRPSLMALEEQYASGWRRRKGQRQRFCEKKQVGSPRRIRVAYRQSQTFVFELVGFRTLGDERGRQSALKMGSMSCSS